MTVDEIIKEINDLTNEEQDELLDYLETLQSAREEDEENIK